MAMWGVTLWLALLALVVLIWQPRLHERSTTLSFALHALLAMPFFVLASLFIANDTSVLHVAAFGGETLPLKYRFAATWAAREGPLLMWLGWMGLLSWLWRKPLKSENFEVHETRLRLSHLMSLTLLLISFSLGPFKSTPAFYIGPGLNPLLQTDLMVIHPPLVFLAYSMCLHLTAIGLSSAYSNHEEGLQARILAVARPALFVATLGIGLGGLWAYLILDWGGYWAWDPVETGSFLPWLALVMLVHLRTRPGSISSSVWAGGAILTGFLALFATTVTRAGGVWASSIHTFVTNDAGTQPDDVFGRLMVLKGDAAATEVLTYTVWMLILIGCWFAVQRQAFLKTPMHFRHVWVVALPPALALIGAVFMSGDDPLFDWTPVPEQMIAGVVLIPLLLLERTVKKTTDDTDWTYHGVTKFPLHVLFVVALYALTSDLLLTLLFTSLLLPLYYAPRALDAWPWASAGVMAGLALAWSQLLTLPVAGLVLLVFLFPWLVAPTDETETSFHLGERRTQLQVALWGSVILVGLYLVLTWVLLISSIDAVNFDAHELYGAPFMAGLGVCFFLYTRRRDASKQNLLYLGGVSVIALLGALFAPNALGADSATAISSTLTRGHVVWLSMPFLILAVAPLGREVVQQWQRHRSKGLRLSIPFSAHIVHFGLLLLLLGHLSTTVLVERGDASHRLTLVRDEVMIHDGLGYEFTDVILQSKDLEVGDGLVVVHINVYETSNGEVGERIGQVEPGMLRFDSQGVPRSEVDTLTRLTGDVVFIFDGSQASSLMQSVQSESLDGVELVRVTVYELPHSHIVWLGWVTMMVGMLMITVLQGNSNDNSLNSPQNSGIEEE